MTVSEAAGLLQPPVTEQQLRAIITALQWQPAGQRRNGRGRPKPTYDWARISRLHAAISPWLVDTRELSALNNTDLACPDGCESSHLTRPEGPP